jgi:hypothetical protein
MTGQQQLQSWLLHDGNRLGEAKAWLVGTLAELAHVPAAARQACFLPSSGTSSSRSSSRDRDWDRHRGASSSDAAEQQLLQLVVEQQPAAVSALLLRDPGWVRDYLSASPAVARAWFGGFDAAGVSRFRFGAKGLANYALRERASVWQLLVWGGKHAQAPAAVAAKPHYFA